MVDLVLLKECLKEKKIKTGVICKALGISRQAWNMKMRGVNEFSLRQVQILSNLLELNDDEVCIIFLGKS